MCDEVSTSGTSGLDFATLLAVLTACPISGLPQISKESLNHRRHRTTKSQTSLLCDPLGFKLLLLLTRQNELNPNHANDAVKQIARISLPGPEACPVWYLLYSRKPANAPIPASTKKVNPVTSSQSWCSTRPTDAALARMPFSTADPVRLRPACWSATRATIPSFLSVETWIIVRFYQRRSVQ